MAARKGTYIITQASNGEALRLDKKAGAMVPVGNSPANRKATTFSSAASAAKAGLTFTHKPQRGRPPHVVIVEVG